MWLTVKEVAELFDTSDRTIQRRIKDFCRRWKICIPLYKRKRQRRKAVWNTVRELATMGDRINITVLVLMIISATTKAYKRLRLKRRDKAIIKYNIVCAYLRYKKENHFKGKQQAFIAKHNEEHPDSTITKRQLEYWCRCYMNGGLLVTCRQ